MCLGILLVHCDGLTASVKAMITMCDAEGDLLSRSRGAGR